MHVRQYLELRLGHLCCQRRQHRHGGLGHRRQRAAGPLCTCRPGRHCSWGRRRRQHAQHYSKLSQRNRHCQRHVHCLGLRRGQCQCRRACGLGLHHLVPAPFYPVTCFKPRGRQRRLGTLLPRNADRWRRGVGRHCPKPRQPAVNEHLALNIPCQLLPAILPHLLTMPATKPSSCRDGSTHPPPWTTSIIEYVCLLLCD